MNSYIGNLVLALKQEMNYDKDQFAFILKNYPFRKKIDEGYLLWPLVISKIRYTVGERIELVLSGTFEKSLRFKEGGIVRLFLKAKENEEKEWHAGVSMVRKNEIRIILSDENLLIEDIPDDKTYGLELIYDEKPYRVMLSVMERLTKKSKTEQNPLIQKIMTGDRCEEKADVDLGQLMISPHLNFSQQLAVRQSLEAKYFSIIHGPPGTGKTTTIVELIRSVHKNVGKILVCAPSNTAVDILAERINQRAISVLRLGNITRIDDNVAELTLESVLKNHDEWPYIKKVKIEADEQEREAAKYKRSFTEEDRKNRFESRKQARELRKWAKDLEVRLIEKVIDESKVICTTLIGAANKELEGILFDLLIIDEASQALEPECWVAIEKSKKVILVGDHKQLPPTIKSQEAKKSGLEITLLDRLTDVVHYSSLLREQYRMHELIMQWPNQQFYNGQLTASDEVSHSKIEGFEPVTFIDTAGTDFEEKVNPESQSYYNEGECFILLEHLIKHQEALKNCTIGIISPYAEQVKHIKGQLQEDVHVKGLDLEVNTIDGFQGEEKDVIYISLTRSNNKNSIGFLSDERRINVAITRAKKALIIIGDSSTLGSNYLFESLLAFIEEKATYSSAWNYML
jgi:ATP-dependent RNA/DNA helicase IGHMBP2